MNLHGNQLFGNIPDEIGNMTQLEELWLGGNNFDGDLPESICELDNLYRLRLYTNQLSGEVPECIWAHPSIIIFGLGYNQFEGEFPWKDGDRYLLRSPDLHLLKKTIEEDKEYVEQIQQQLDAEKHKKTEQQSIHISEN